MKRRTLILETARTGYTPEQVTGRPGALTVADLISYLEQYEEDDFVVISHDGGFTYGTLNAPEE